MAFIPSVTESKFAPFAEFRFKAAAAGGLRLILSFDVFIKSRIGPKGQRTYYGVNRGGVPPEGRRSLAASGISPRGRRETAIALLVGFVGLADNAFEQKF